MPGDAKGPHLMTTIELDVRVHALAIHPPQPLVIIIIIVIRIVIIIIIIIVFIVVFHLTQLLVDFHENRGIISPGYTGMQSIGLYFGARCPPPKLRALYLAPISDIRSRNTAKTAKYAMYQSDLAFFL